MWLPDLGHSQDNLPSEFRLIEPLEQFLLESYRLQFWTSLEIAKKVGLAEAIWSESILQVKLDGGNYDYDGHYRWFRVGHIDEEREYNKIKSNGCCGFEEWEVVDPQGQVWWFGFNYGH